MVPQSENQPEHRSAADEQPVSNATTSIPIREIPVSKPFQAFKHQFSSAYLNEYGPIHECFLDEESTIRIPELKYYQGRPSGFPDNVVGSYELLGLPEDICFERYGRLGPYGFGYSSKYGGTGTGEHGDAGDQIRCG